LPAPQGLRWRLTPAIARPAGASMALDADRIPGPQGLRCSLTPAKPNNSSASQWKVDPVFYWRASCASRQGRCILLENRPTMTKAESRVARTAGGRAIDRLKPVDKPALGAASKQPGCNESERKDSLVTQDSGSRAFMMQAKAVLTGKTGKCARKFRRGDSDGMAARMRSATGEALLVPRRNPRSMKSYNRQHREMDGRREGVGWAHSSDEQVQQPASEGALRTATPLAKWEARVR